MAVSWGAAGTAVYSVGNSAPGYPTGITAGDMLLLLVGTKPGTSTNSAPGDWTSLISYASTTGTTGIDTGPMLIEVWYKIADGSETGTITVTNDGSNSISAAQILRVGKDAGSWEIAGATGEDTSGGTSWSATCSSNPGITSGDFLVFGGVIPTDVSTPTQFSAEAVTATGATIGTATEIGEWDTSSGQDMGGFMAYAACTAGTASAAPVVTATAGGTTTNVYGPSYVIRLRENDSATSAYPQAAAVASESADATCTPAPQVPPTHQSTTFSSWTYSSSITIAVPANAAAGDVMVVGIYSENTTSAISPPDGTWTQIGNQQTAGAPSFRSAVFWKRLTGADSGNYVFSSSGGPYSGGFCSRFTGVIDTGDAIDNFVDAKDDGQTSDSPANVYLTPNSAPTYVYAAGFDYGGDSTDGTVGPTSPDSSWVELYNPQGNAEDGVAWGHDLLTADQIGPVQITSFASGTGSTIHILTLKAPSAGSPSTNANAQAAEVTSATADAGTSTSPTVEAAAVATADATAGWTEAAFAQVEAAAVNTATADAGTSTSPTAQVATATTATVDAGTSTSPTAEVANVAAVADVNPTSTATSRTDAPADTAEVATAGADVTGSVGAPVQSAEVASSSANAGWTEAALAQAGAAAVGAGSVNPTSGVGAAAQTSSVSTATADPGTSASPTIEAATVSTAADVNATTTSATYTNAQAQPAEVTTADATAGWIEAALAQVEAAAAGTGSANATVDKNAQPIAQTAAVSTSTVDAGCSASPTVQVSSVSTEPADVTAQTTGATQAQAQAATVTCEPVDAGVVTDHRAAAASADVATGPANATAQVSAYPPADAATVSTEPADPSPSVGPTAGYAQAGVAVVNATVQIGHMVDAVFADAMATAWDTIARTAVLVGAGVAAVSGSAQDAVAEKIAGVTYRPYAGLTSPGDDGHVDRPDTGTTVRPLGGAV